jgi:hypothetical protein
MLQGLQDAVNIPVSEQEAMKGYRRRESKN